MSNKQQHRYRQLVITRPAGQAESLVRRLRQVVGHSITVKHLPLIQIAPLELSPLALNDVHGIIFISGNAARLFFDSINSLEKLRSVQLLAVGDRTAAEIERLSGYKALFPQQMNSEGLLQLPQLHSISGQHWLIIKGEGGRPMIYRSLTEKGAKVTELDVYRRTLPDLNTQQQICKVQEESPLWLITSGEALTNLHRILGLVSNPGHRINVVVSSVRLAALASQKGFTIYAQSAGASELQLVECIRAFETDNDRE